MAERIPDAELTVLEGAGHNHPLSLQPIIAEHIDAFIRRSRSGVSGSRSGRVRGHGGELPQASPRLGSHYRPGVAFGMSCR